MKRKHLNLTILGLLFLFLANVLHAQVTVTGKVMDGENNEPLMMAPIVIKGKTVGTSTDLDGNFTLVTDVELPFTIEISYVGLEKQLVEITQSNQTVDVKLRAQAVMSDLVIVSASRVEEKILESPVTVEKMDIIAIRQSSTNDYYDGISKLKGVQTTSGSLTFTSFNTRGFATIANTRFVQLMDGMDNAAPLLNFPTGNIVGIGELDINNVELVPGAASALYGPNAFNGILLMNSKSPFNYEGLSVQLKGGVTQSKQGGTEPLYNVGARYAKSFNDRLAFKVNASYLNGKDWRANDYTTDRNLKFAQIEDPDIDPTSNVGQPNFDGMNTYGDESQIFVPLNTTPFANGIADALISAGAVPAILKPVVVGFILDSLKPVDLRRTGFTEEVLEDNNNAQSFKSDVALHYRIGNDAEISANYRYGSGASVYQGSERYALRDFSQQYFKLELSDPDYMVRAYMSQTNDGDSYNFTALGAFVNEYFSPTASEWASNYLGNYVGQHVQNWLDPNGTITTAAFDANAHLEARTAANAPIPATDSEEFQEVVRRVRDTLLFQGGGAGFIDNSRLYHAEGNYNFSSMLDKKIDILVGGNYRMYDLFTDGTIFNEDPEGVGINDRIRIGEFGVYTQISKKLIQERLKLTGSIRYDKNQNFTGQISPRLSAVYSAGAKREHNFRASFQTGFRNPDTQAQYIWFPTTNILIGSSRDNAERYGIHEGGAYTKDSYDAFIGNQLVTGMPDSSLLKEIFMDYIQPEQLTAYEIGYKTELKRKLFLDLNFYYNTYKDFITAVNVVNKNQTVHRNDTLPPGTVFRPYVNATETIYSWGIGFGFSYKLPKDFNVRGNYSWAAFSESDENDEFDVGFNTPNNRFTIGVGNRDFYKGIGFDLSYRWQEGFLWQNSFAIGNIPAYGSLDAQINYAIKKLNTTVKLGATNILGPEYQTNTGGPFVGRQIFISLTYDEFMK